VIVTVSRRPHSLAGFSMWSAPAMPALSKPRLGCRTPYGWAQSTTGASDGNHRPTPRLDVRRRSGTASRLQQRHVRNAPRVARSVPRLRCRWYRRCTFPRPLPRHRGRQFGTDAGGAAPARGCSVHPPTASGCLQQVIEARRDRATIAEVKVYDHIETLRLAVREHEEIHLPLALRTRSFADVPSFPPPRIVPESGGDFATIRLITLRARFTRDLSDHPQYVHHRSRRRT